MYKRKIIAGQSILENTLTRTVFLAGKSDEETQLDHKNHQHIEWVGELDIKVPDIEDVLWKLYDKIKHGDDKHQQWLRDEIELFIDQNCY